MVLLVIRKMGYKILSILIGLMLSINLNAAFFEQNAEGWHWYQDPIIEEHQEPKEFKHDANPSTPTDIINSYKKELEKKLHMAIVYPTHKNIQAYQEMQRDLMQRSHHFAKTWMQVVYQHPELDHTLVSPVNQKARHIYLDQEKSKVASLIRDLKEEYGLFFFFSSDCAYCHQFAPMVQQFAAKHEWKVVAISLDGGVIPGFKEILPDNGLASKWQIKVLPALFVVNPKSSQVVPIAWGLTSLEEIEERITLLMEQI